MLLAMAVLLVACDFNGPWSFYPEETEIYTGIYTYGYIIEGESPRVCFSKTYQLKESEGENFAWYDSAYVTVTGSFQSSKSDEGDLDSLTVVLEPEHRKPKCFSVPEDYGFVPQGVGGEKYALHAYFKWDSAGTDVESEFSAEAKIPVGFELTGINVPQKDGSYKWRDIDYGGMEFDFLEYPMDMMTYNLGTAYDSSIGGVIMTMEYSLIDGGENQNIFLNSMFGGMIEKDSMGYGGIALHDPLESSVYEGFQENSVVAGINKMDTIYITNMSFAIGKSTLHFYATDSAYFLYYRYVQGAFEDPTVVPRSNIENGMGVFSGMSHLVFPMTMKGESVPYSHIALTTCVEGGLMDDESWGSRSCRLFQDVYCSGLADEYNGEKDGLYNLNAKASEYYREDKYQDRVVHEFCFAPAIKAAFMLDTTSWKEFLPPGLPEVEVDIAFGDAMKRYCVATNYTSNNIMDCGAMKDRCVDDLEMNDCKDYLWTWCSDRNWDIEKYEQCGSGLVSRYYLQKQQSSILEKAVKNWCKKHKNDPQCKERNVK